MANLTSTYNCSSWTFDLIWWWHQIVIELKNAALSTRIHITYDTFETEAVRAALDEPAEKGLRAVWAACNWSHTICCPGEKPGNPRNHFLRHTVGAPPELTHSKNCNLWSKYFIKSDQGKTTRPHCNLFVIFGLLCCRSARSLSK